MATNPHRTRPRRRDPRGRVEELGEELAVLTRELEADREAFAAFDAEMAGLLRSGESREYNQLVPEYNRMAGGYNSAVDAHTVMLGEAKAAVSLHNRLAGHAHDRPGSYLRAREYLAG